MNMRGMHPELGGLLVLAACVMPWLSGCVDTREVIVDAAAFENPPAAAGGFLGYARGNGTQPVCGGCHPGSYNEWKGTEHAHAWESLEESGAAAATCENCHTVGPLGNATVTQAGYAATKDSRYHDVQCESCHGPGLNHVTDPEATQPLASIEVDTARQNGCGECHSGAHAPFVEEWAVSRHGKRGTHQQEEAACVQCHEAKGVLAAWGLKPEYAEQEDADTPNPIVCAVCHDPHNATNDHQLRYPINVADVERNLCMKCHHKRAVPELTNTRGAHSPQGPLLLGAEVGWVPPNMSYNNGQIVGTHGTARNPRLCAGCHVNRTEVTDKLTGKFVFNSTGHLFKPIPCLDAQGIPNAVADCPLEQRSFKSCTTANCHGSEVSARSALTVARTRLTDLANTTKALLTKVPASEFSITDNRISTAEGSKFNADMCLQAGSAIHNPFLCEALLTAGIKQLKAEYGVTAPSALALTNVLGH